MASNCFPELEYVCTPWQQGRVGTNLEHLVAPIVHVSMVFVLPLANVVDDIAFVAVVQVHLASRQSNVL